MRSELAKETSPCSCPCSSQLSTSTSSRLFLAHFCSTRSSPLPVFPAFDLFGCLISAHIHQWYTSGGMAFAGTTEKCKACEKTVYLVDQLAVDSKLYHKSCFRCHHCKGTLKLSNYSSFEGVLYCKPHFDQLFKRTGSLDKSFESIPRANKADRSSNHEGHTNSRVSSLYAGTQDKCVACKRTVYPIEKVAVDGTSYHRPCFKCSHGGCNISPSSYVAHEGRIYCKHHHSQLFKARGNFSQLDKQEPVIGVTENTVSSVQPLAE